MERRAPLPVAPTLERWVTEHKRAWNLKRGDQVEFFDTRRRRCVTRTVSEVSPYDGDPGQVLIRFRRYRWGLRSARYALLRVRRRKV